MDEQPEFLVLPAPAPVDRVLECVWFASDVGTLGSRERVLPNGVVELIVSLEPEPYGVVRGSAVHGYRRSWLCGVQRGPLVIQAPGRGQLVGLRFRPGGLRGLWRTPLHELTDEVVAAEAFDPVLCELRERLGAAERVTERLDAVRALLTPRLDLAALANGKVFAALRTLRAEPELGMRALADRLGVTHQHLVRLFHDGVGVPPRMLARILRFDGVVRAVGPRHAPPPWAHVAASAGYYDQSHLVAEFRNLAGVTPTEYWRRRLPGGAHLAEAPAPPADAKFFQDHP